MTTPLWRLVDVTVPGRRGPRLDHVSLEIPAGVTAVLGPSGAGKTTLLNLLVGFEKSYTGTITRIGFDVLAPGESPGGNVDASPPHDSWGAKTAERDQSERLPLFWVPPGHGLWRQGTVRNHLASIMPSPNAAAVEQLL